MPEDRLYLHSDSETGLQLYVEKNIVLWTKTGKDSRLFTTYQEFPSMVEREKEGTFCAVRVKSVRGNHTASCIITASFKPRYHYQLMTTCAKAVSNFLLIAV